MPIRYVLIILLGIVLHNEVSCEEYLVRGTNDIFCVTDDAIEATPEWNPETDSIPVSPASAIKLASDYHNKKVFEGFIQYHAWTLAGATLVKHGDTNWYWVVQFRGVFNPLNKRGNDGSLIGGYSYAGDKIIYNRVPVLFDGKLATIRRDKPTLPVAMHEVTAESASK